MPRQTDYPELEGKEIVFRYESGNEVAGKVIGCNYDIGLTIVSRDNSSKYLKCLVGPSASNFSDPNSKAAIRKHKTVFFAAVSWIKSGVFCQKKSFKLRDAVYSSESCFMGPDSSHCPYNQ